ncbi:unnamed protein product [Somion occarium]|uniref:Aminoglycoside phosphotransferase domain-containing protein n=1 Tax=Somion occarium TaxID=3059160 RepID=A0ABP1DWK5_9APHY
MSPPHLPSTPSSNSNRSNDSFGPLRDIPFEKLQAVVAAATVSSRLVIHAAPKEGSYNLAHFLADADSRTVYVVRVALPECVDALTYEADVAIMKLISSTTTIPMPVIFGHSSSIDNPLGYPYMITSFIAGVRLCDLWYDRQALPMEQRLLILEQIARALVQLEVFEYDKIGSLTVDPNGLLRVGPLRPDPEDGVDMMGPFENVQDYTNARLATVFPNFVWNFAMRLLAPALQQRSLNVAPFVLCHPDLELQNVIVDPVTFELRGFLDWDGVSRTVPRSIGYGSYPHWICRDWITLLYGTDAIDPDNANKSLPDETVNGREPVEILSSYRDHYLAVVRDIRPELAESVTHRSHISMTLELGLGSEIFVAGCAQKLFSYAFKNTVYDPLASFEALRWSDWYKDEGGEVKALRRHEVARR